MEKYSNDIQEENEISFNSLLAIEPFYNINQESGKIMNYKKKEAKESLDKMIKVFCDKFNKSREEILIRIKKLIEDKQNLSENSNFTEQYKLMEELIEEFENEEQEEK